MNDRRKEVVRWVALYILPHEKDLRRSLLRSVPEPADVNDIIQQAYCRLSELDYTGHIKNARAYFFATARSILLERLRRERIVQIQAVADLDVLPIIDDAPSPETAIGAKLELRTVLDALNNLPESYREALRLRRIEGLSLKEAAQRLGVSEKIIENNTARGLRMLLSVLGEASLRAEGEAAEISNNGGSRAYARH